MTQPDRLREADQKALGGRAWDLRYWCSVHQLAHSARELMEEHTTSISSAPDLIAAVEALPGSATFGEVWINRRAVLALLRAAASREAGS